MANPAQETIEQGFAQDKQDYWAMREELLTLRGVRQGRQLTQG